jgi:hypothetical protein
MDSMEIAQSAFAAVTFPVRKALLCDIASLELVGTLAPFIETLPVAAVREPVLATFLDDKGLTAATTRVVFVKKDGNFGKGKIHRSIITTFIGSKKYELRP